LLFSPAAPSSSSFRAPGATSAFARISSRLSSRFGALVMRARPLFLRLDRPLYAVWAAVWTIASARAFYAYMLKQTGGEWSAPLDDVFIHFDFARATARGHPFEWVEGNGYSSGNTSLLYPFVLAVGYVLGFRDLRLMVWAAIVAAVSVFGVLLVARRLFLVHEKHDRKDARARVLSYVLPPVLLAVGALDWSLWSGMEVAVFLATWALALLAFFALDRAPSNDRPRRARAAWVLGLAGALMIVTRPEAVTTIAVLGFTAVLPRFARERLRAPFFELVRVGLPGAFVVVAQQVANRALTGEWSANGAIVKLALNSPYLTGDEKIDDYVFNLKYGVLRNVEYHFADSTGWGLIVPALACAALAAPRSRRMAALLWSQIVGWMVLVSLNGQVRWQNERYLMPAVAWLLMAVALGVASLVRRDRGARPTFLVATFLGAMLVQLFGALVRPEGSIPTMRIAWPIAIAIGMGGWLVLRWWPVRGLAVVAALVLAQQHQVSKMRDQRWFFGRASRNIRDQHVTTGRRLREMAVRIPAHDDVGPTTWRPKRVLVGDAGAIVYAADMPALDIIGLGGYHRFPFARAGINGLPSTIELMEYVPPDERPDVMAIYPSWWGILPTWFSKTVLDRVPAEGNVICGGYEDVVYLSDWSLLGTGNDPRLAPQGEAVKDEVDVADVLSEKRHAYAFPHPGGGWTEMKVLADPVNGRTDMLDGGRRIAAGREERFVVGGRVAAQKAAHLVVRSAPEAKAHVRVLAGDRELAAMDLDATEGWVEKVVELPADAVGEETHVTFANDGPNDFIDYHVWVTQ
jgi:hypothetical protein